MAPARPKHRVYIDSPLTPQGWPLDKDRNHYLRRVLRLGNGDQVVAFDGTGREWTATLSKGATPMLAPLSMLPQRETESLRVTLVQSLARGERMDLALQKATELGVWRVQPVVAERTEVRLDKSRAQRRQQHWQRVMIHAAEQSGRTQIPHLLPLRTFADWLAQPPEGDLKLILAPGGALALRDLQPGDGCIVAAVGPEGGFAEREIEAALEADFQALTLGPRILRTETAGPALLAAVQTLWGDMG